MEDSSVQAAYKESPDKKPNKRPNWSGISMLIGFSALMGFLYFDRNDGITGLVQSFGASGIIGAVLMMGVMCSTPFPSEGLLIMYLKIYGIFWGMVYSLLGFMLGLIAVFAFARFLGKKAIGSRISVDHRFKAVESWITNRGTVGLLAVRLLPIPAFIVNLLTGILPSVSFWKYLWTGTVGIIPYYGGVSLIFLGISSQNVLPFIIGIPILIFLFLLGYWNRRL